VVTNRIAKKSRPRRTAHVQQKRPAQTQQHIVLVVDDDESALSAIARLIRAAGFTVQTFGEPRAILTARLPIRDACLVSDIYLPEMNGIELCQALAATGHALPTILITARRDEMTNRLVKDFDAIAVLFKPIDESLLFDAIARCFATSPGSLA